MVEEDDHADESSHCSNRGLEACPKVCVRENNLRVLFNVDPALSLMVIEQLGVPVCQTVTCEARSRLVIH